MVMPENHFQRKQTYTYADYLTLSTDERYELIDGTLYNMSPAPSTKHQQIAGALYRQFGNYLEGRSCQVFIAPFDVRLLSQSKRDEDVTNVVQPDISVICDPDKIDEKGCNGSPDLIIEVLSPATAKKDKGEKLRLYRKAGVRQYWIVDPANETVEIFDFSVNLFADAFVYGKADRITVSLFTDFEIELSTIFK